MKIDEELELLNGNICERGIMPQRSRNVSKSAENNMAGRLGLAPHLRPKMKYCRLNFAVT